MGVASFALRQWQRRKDRQAADVRTAAIRAAINGEPITPPAPSWRRELAVGAASGTWRLGRRHRKLIAPFAGMGTLWLSGVAVATQDGAVGAWITWLLGGALWWQAKLRRLDRAAERRYAAAVWVGALAWLVLATLAGVRLATPFLVVYVAAAATPWWWHHRPRPRPADPPALEGGDTFAERWDSNVAGTGGVAPGSALQDPEVAEDWTTYTLALNPGAAGQHCQGLNTNLHRIATGVRVPQEQLLIEPHPTFRDPSLLRLRHLAYSPAREVEYLETPQYDVGTGTVTLGPHTDHDGSAGLRIYRQNGMMGGFLLGGTGSGKTRQVESIVLALRWAWAQHGIPTAVVYLDGQDGASSPILWEHSTIAAGPGEVDEVLDCLDDMAGMRQAYNRTHRLAGFTPGRSPSDGVPPLTGVLVVHDEMHIMTPGRGKRFGAIARERRKIGMAMLGADQTIGLDTFGHEEGLRASLFDGGAVVMRVSSKTQGNLVPGLQVNPFELPAIPGYGVKVSTPQSGERTAPFRGFWLPSQEDRDTGRAPEHVRTVEEWFQATEDAPLDEMSARAFAPFLERRAERAAQREARDLALMEGRELVPASRERATAGPSGGPVLELLSGLIDRGAPRSAETARAAHLAVATAPRRPARERIPELLAEHGPLTRQELAGRLGVSPSAVTQALRRAEGVVQAEGGAWDLQNRTRAASA